MKNKIKMTIILISCVATVASFTACTKKNGKEEQTTSAVESTTIAEAVTEPNSTRVDETTKGSTETYQESTTNSTTGVTDGTTNKQISNKAPTTVKTSEHKPPVKTTAKSTIKKTTTQATTKKATTTKATTTKTSTTKPTTTNQEKVLYYYPDTGTYGYEPKEGALYQNASGSWESYVKPNNITPEEIAEAGKNDPTGKWY